MNDNDLVTVYITTQNRYELLERALSSVLNQSYKNLDIIIVDDFSSDKTRELISALCQKHKNIRCFFNESIRGACYSRNVAIKNAKGKFITGLDDDDEFEHNRIEILHELYLTNSYSCVTSTFYLEKSEGQREIYKDKSGVINLKMLMENNYIGNQVFTETSKLKCLGGFDVSFPAFQDYDMWVRLVEKFGDAYKTKTPLYIVHVDHDKPRITTSGRRINGLEMFLSKHKNLMDVRQFSNHSLNVKLMRGEPVKWSDFFKFKTFYCFLRLMKRKILING